MSASASSTIRAVIVAWRSSVAKSGTAGPMAVADRGEELSLAVRRVLEDHRAVEREEHAMNRSRCGQAFEHAVPDVLEHRPGHRPRGDGIGGDRRDHLDAGGDERVEEAAHLGPRAPEALDHLVAVEELGRAEVLEVRPLADEGVRLLHELTDRDADRGQALTVTFRHFASSPAAGESCSEVKVKA